MYVKSPTSAFLRNRIRSLILVIFLVLSTLAAIAQLPTQARGFVVGVGSVFQEDGVPTIPVEGASLDARIKGTDAGFTAKADEIGFWYHYNIPITGEPNGIFDRKAQFENDKLQVTYEHGQVRFTVKTEEKLHFGKIFNLAGQEITTIQFYEVDPATFEASWQPQSVNPAQLFIFKDDKGRTAKVTPWMINSGSMMHQEANLSSIIPNAKKGAADTNGTVTYILTYTHPNYQTLIVETEFRTSDINLFNVEMSPKAIWEHIIVLNTKDYQLNNLADVNWSFYDPQKFNSIFATGNTGENALDTIIYTTVVDTTLECLIKTYKEGYIDYNFVFNISPGVNNVVTYNEKEQKVGAVRVAIETSEGEFLPGKIVLSGLDVEYKDSVVLDELPVHDFTNIPIDASDGITTLQAMVVPTSIAFDTAFINIDIVEGNNPFQSLIVNKTEIVGKRIAIEAILGQSEVPAENYWIIIRDESGTELYNELASASEHLTPKFEEGTKVTVSAYFPIDDPLNRDETHAGFVRAPLSIGAMASPGDTIIALPLRFTPLAPLDPYTDQPLPLDPYWITDMTGGSYNLSYWDDRKETVYLDQSEEKGVDIPSYDAAIAYIKEHFKIPFEENRVSTPITGDAYGSNVTQDGTGGVTSLRGATGRTHIGANINITMDLKGIIKERLGRWFEFTTVTKRDNSFMKASASLPTPEDRAIVYEIIKHQEAINDGKATYIQLYIGKTSNGGF